MLLGVEAAATAGFPSVLAAGTDDFTQDEDQQDQGSPYDIEQGVSLVDALDRQVIVLRDDRG